MTDTAENDAVQYPCAHCGRTNRILRERLLDNPTCGACKQRLFPDDPVTVTDSNWTREVEACPIPVLVDFWAPWCGPCRAVGPVLEQIAHERAGRLKVVKVNVDENPRVAAQHGIRSIPALMLFRGPLLLDQQLGAMPKPSLDVWLERFV